MEVATDLNFCPQIGKLSLEPLFIPLGPFREWQGLLLLSTVSNQLLLPSLPAGQKVHLPSAYNLRMSM